MKKIVAALAAVSIIAACHKAANNSVTTADDGQMLTDFVQKVALPQYQALQDKATALNAAVNTLSASPTNDNLTTARQAWKDTRGAWEQCEGFLFGPVEDNNYDPNMDTWPVDYLQLDSVIANNTTFTVGMVAGLGQSLRGFHPLEFILWGKSGNATSDSITDKQKQYMVALSQDILNTVSNLNNSWSVSGGDFQQQVLQAGKGSTRFTSKQDALLAIVSSMSDICNEVGQQSSGGKIYDPFIARDSNVTESPFSHNSMTDFKNNITGAQNVYLCSFNGQQGASISSFVAARSLSLDKEIRQNFINAINALNNVNVNFETAIFTQRTQLQTAMTALNTLQASLDGDLKTFIMTYVKD